MITLDSKAAQTKVSELLGASTFDMIYECAKTVKENDAEIKKLSNDLETLKLKKLYEDSELKLYSKRVSQELFCYVAEGDEAAYKNLLSFSLKDGKLTQGCVLADGTVKDRHVVYLDSVAKAASFLSYLLKLKNTIKNTKAADSDAISAAKADIQKSIRLAPLSKMITFFCKKHKNVSESELRNSYLSDFNTARAELKKALVVDAAKAKAKAKAEAKAEK